MWGKKARMTAIAMGLGIGLAATVQGATGPGELRAKAMHGDAEAQVELAKDYLQGLGVKQDAAKGAKWMRKAADQGNARAQSYLGGLYTYGTGVTQSATEAAKWTLKAAEQGFAPAQYRMGKMYEKGQGVPASAVKAARWYGKAVANGLEDGTFFAGIPDFDAVQDTLKGDAYANGNGVGQDDAAAFAAYLEAAKHGFLPAQRIVGMAYATGRGTQRNVATAIDWLQQPAMHSDIRAQFELAELYGKGATHDQAKAAAWLRLAAEGGDARAQYQLGNRLRAGQGVKQDHAQAAEWYLKAAERGVRAAQIELGRAYAAGDGVREDPAEAFFWLVLGSKDSAGPAPLPLLSVAQRAKLSSKQADATGQRILSWTESEHCNVTPRSFCAVFAFLSGGSEDARLKTLAVSEAFLFPESSVGLCFWQAGCGIDVRAGMLVADEGGPINSALKSLADYRSVISALYREVPIQDEPVKRRLLEFAYVQYLKGHPVNMTALARAAKVFSPPPPPPPPVTPST